MAGILYCILYLLLFFYLINKGKVFRLPGLSKNYSTGAFALKLVFAAALWAIYTYHYKNRYSSDIFKYYDDGMVMYQTIHSSFSDFIKMVTGIGDSSAHIQTCYHEMKSWVNDHNSTLYNNSHFIVRINALFVFLSGGHYAVHVLFMCFISFIGLVLLYKSFYPYLADKPKELFAAVFLFPSVLLWSSGILKECFVFLGLGLSIYYFTKILAKEGTARRNLLLVAAGFILIFEAKAYVLLCLLPGFISSYLIHKVKISARHPVLTYIVITAVYLAAGFNMKFISPRLNALKMLSDKQTEFINTARGGIHMVLVNDSNQYAYLPVEDSVNIIPANAYADSLWQHGGIQYITSSAFCYREELTHKTAPFMLARGTLYKLVCKLYKDTLNIAATDSTLYRLDTYIEPAKSRIDITPIKPTMKSLLSYVPNALLISFIRPYPHEIHSAAVLIYFCENVLVFLLVILTIAFSKRKIKDADAALFCLGYCLLMLVLIGVSTPIYGGIERYKAVIMPFMLILLLLVYNKDKLKRTLKR